MSGADVLEPLLPSETAEEAEARGLPSLATDLASCAAEVAQDLGGALRGGAPTRSPGPARLAPVPAPGTPPGGGR